MSTEPATSYYTSRYSGEQIDNLLSGLAVEIGGSYANLAAIQAAFPTGDTHAYQAADTGNVYTWNSTEQEWQSLGKIQGPIGLQGDPGKTAYQYAVEGGYTGTEAQFEALLGRIEVKAANAADSAAEAAGSATTAAQAATSASGSAATAASKAAEAQDAAGTAGASASAAADRASEAAGNAEAASGSAEAAAGSKAAAEQAASATAGSAASAQASAANAASSAQDAAASAQTARQYSGKPPVIQNGTWWTWDAEQQAYTDTGEAAQGPQGDVTMEQVNAAIDAAITGAMEASY